MTENIRLALKGISSHKLRSFLTMLGIIIGIAAIISIVSIIKGTNKQIEDNLIGDGTHTVNIELYQDGLSYEFGSAQVPSGVSVFDDSIRAELMNIDGVEKVSVYRKRAGGSANAWYKNTDLSSCEIIGADVHYTQTKGLQITKGRGITDNDIMNGRKICIVDDIAVKNAFAGADPLGETIDLGGEPFIVVGTVSQKSAFQPVINSLDDYYTYSQNATGSIIIPIETWPVVFGYDEPQSFVVKAASTDKMTAVGKAAADILNSKQNFPEDSKIMYQSSDMAAEAAKLQQLSASTNVMLVGIAVISLVVGGIGVMNIMLVSVTERTREIGLKKAIGARKKAIRRQFLTEAAMLSVMGGILGVIAGLILARVISAAAQVPVAISVPSIFISVLVSVGIGIGFGIMPAAKASNMNPIDALRYE